MTKITLCMIARNEAAMLPGCLESVRDAVDEVIVVDTGSTDETVALAEAAGATVVEFAWCDDFAAARNAAVERVSEGFVLVLDADERLAPGSAAALRAAVESGSLDCGRLALHNASRLDATPQAVLSGEARLGPPLLLERLLRWSPDLRWQGVVHEHITAWANQGKRIATVDAAIIHFGAVPELRAALGKATRNLGLLERAVEAEPNNAVYLTYFAQELLRDEQTARARRVLHTAWSRICDLKRANQPAPDCISTASLWSSLLMDGGQLDEALTVLAQARSWSGPHPNLDWAQARALQLQWSQSAERASASPLLQSAAQACERSLACAGAVFTAPVMDGGTSWAAASQLGILRLLQERPAEALAAFDQALSANPVHVPARLGRLEALVFSGNPAQGLAEAEPLLDPRLPDGWILAAAAGFQFGGYEAVAPMVEQARRSLEERELIAAHRLAYLQELESLAPLQPNA